MKSLIKNIITGLILLVGFVSSTNAQGKFAGSMSGIIGKTYTDSYHIEGMEGWEFREGSVITPIDDPEMMTVDVFQQGAAFVVLFSYMEDTATRVFEVADIIEIKNIKNGWQIKTALCRQNGIENIEIVALVKPTNTEYIKNVRQAWRFNRDKRRVESISPKGIDCLNEGFDMVD